MREHSIVEKLEAYKGNYPVQVRSTPDRGLNRKPENSTLYFREVKVKSCYYKLYS